ncbi:MAG: hypothetical protein QOG53_329 [Frankiales bacterium]|jgi:uncharacterized membrane protein YkoI|nr:hypothetical protein [Frankiales bacterium]
MNIDKTSAAIGAAAAVLVGAAGLTYAAVANAADPTPSPSSSGSSAPRNPDAGKHQAAEAELTGATAASVKAAILKKYPGATIQRMSAEDAAEGTGAAYEAHVATADGKRLEVLLDKSFAITKASEDTHGPGGRGGPGGHNEAELTGATAASVKAAILKKYPGATIERMSAEDAAEGTGAAYEAHVATADGKRLAVLLDKSFAITKASEDTHGPGHGGPGDHRGGPPPSSSSSSSFSTTSA